MGVVEMTYNWTVLARRHGRYGGVWADLQRIAGVLLDAQDGELDGDVEGRVGDVGLLVTQTHGADEACGASV